MTPARLAALCLAAFAAAGCTGKKEEAAAPPVAGNALTMTQGEDLSKRALEVLNQKCTACHGAERFEAKAFTPEEWGAVLERMVAKGAKLSGDELDVLRHWRKAP